MTPSQALTVAHACQYVDDATTPGILRFQGGETFERFATAHKTFDYANTENDQNRLVWAPFHFLPAGEGATLDEKAVCRADSAVARASGAARHPAAQHGDGLASSRRDAAYVCGYVGAPGVRGHRKSGQPGSFSRGAGLHAHGLARESHSRHAAHWCSTSKPMF